MTEELRLEATVVDKFSKPLRDLRSRLNDVKPPEHIGKMAAEFQRVENAVKSASGSITKNLGTAMAGLSIPSLAAVASIGGIVAAVKSFSTATIELRQFQRETGITIGSFKALKHSASQFGVNEDVIGPGLKKFSENLFDFRRRFGSTYAEILQIQPEFMKRLRENSPDKALEESLNYLEQLARERGPRSAGILSEKLFGTDVFARFGLRGKAAMREAIEAMRAAADKLTPKDEDIAVRFAASVEKLQEAFSKVSKTVGNELAPAFVQVMESTHKFIEANQGKIGTAVKDALDGITTSAKNFDWRGFGRDLTTIGHALARVAKHFDGRTGQRQATGGAIDEIQDNLAKARKRLADYDKAHPNKGAVGLRDPERQRLTGDVQFYEDRLAKATARGVELGMDRFFQRQSFTKRKSSDDEGAPRITQASFEGEGFGGGADGEHARRSIARHFRPPSFSHDRGSDAGLGGGRAGFMRREAHGGPGFGHSGALPSGPMPHTEGRAAAGTLRGTLFSGESGGDPGIFNYYNAARRLRVGHFDATKTTIGDIVAAQRSGRMFASGLYQVIPKTMQGAIAALKLGSKDVYNTELQNRIYTDYLAGSKRPNIRAYLEGRGSLSRANLDLAMEWASVADPRTGRSFYHHDRASISVARAQSALKGAKSIYDRLLREGVDPDTARRSALLGVEHPQAAVRGATDRLKKMHEDRKQNEPQAGIRSPFAPSSGRDQHAQREHSAHLLIQIDELGRVRRTKANGGDLFHKMSIARGRTMIPAASA